MCAYLFYILFCVIVCKRVDLWALHGKVCCACLISFVLCISVFDIYIRQKELIVLIYYTISFEHSFGDGWLANHQTNSQWEEGWLPLIGSWRGPHRLHVYWYKHPVPLIEVILPVGVDTIMYSLILGREVLGGRCHA